MDFLKQHGFRHEAPFTEGVPYMSRKEEAATRLIHASDAANRSSLKDIEIKENDVDALSFLVSLRTAIKEWLANDGVSSERVNYWQHCTPRIRLASVTVVTHRIWLTVSCNRTVRLS